MVGRVVGVVGGLGLGGVVAVRRQCIDMAQFGSGCHRRSCWFLTGRTVSFGLSQTRVLVSTHPVPYIPRYPTPQVPTPRRYPAKPVGVGTCGGRYGWGLVPSSRNLLKHSVLSIP